MNFTHQACFFFYTNTPAQSLDSKRLKIQKIAPGVKGLLIKARAWALVVGRYTINENKKKMYGFQNSIMLKTGFE